MIMSPTTLPDKTAHEIVSLYLQLGPGIGTATISAVPTFTSVPADLIFSGPVILDSGQTAAVFAAGGTESTSYVISAICPLSDGQTLEPVVSMRVVADSAETTPGGVWTIQL